MAIQIDIKGEGRVEKLEDNNSVILTALPSDAWSFKYFSISGVQKTDNPIEVDKTIEDVEAIFYVSIEDYLKGMVGFDVPTSTINSIRINREITKGSDVAELSDKDKDLAYADLLMWASTNPSSYTGSKQSDGGWTQTEASKTLNASDKKSFRSMAMDIYKRYGDRRYTPKVRIRNLW